MRRRRAEPDHAVYWPAFADVLTALVVVLLCSFAVTSGVRSASEIPSTPAPVKGGSEEPISQSQSQYENEILAVKREQVLPQLQRDFQNRVVRGEWLEIRLCSFTSDSVPENEIQACTEAVKSVANKLNTGALLNAIEKKYSLVLASPYLRARTGATNSGTSELKFQLREAQTVLATIIRGMGEPQYIERGTVRAATYPSS